MTITIGNRWAKFDYRFWGHKGWFYSKLKDGFVIHFWKFSLICKTK